MNMFDEIEQAKKDLPRVKSLTNKVEDYPFNGYQKFAIITYIICFILGILFGNLFPACGTSSTLYVGACVSTQFNFSLMLFIWFVSFLLCLFFFALGHIIALLTSIDQKLGKKL